MTEERYTKSKSGYLERNPSWHTEDSPWKAGQILKMLDRNRLKVRSIAEVGCGGGGILRELHERMPDKTIEFTGYDIAPDAIQMCETRTTSRLKFYIDGPEHERVRYDLLLMIDVFEHVEDYMDFLRRETKRAPCCIFHIPLDMSVIGLLRNRPIADRRAIGHLHYFMKDTALATLKDCGLEVIDYFYTPSSIEAGNPSYKTRILNIFRRFLFVWNPDLTVKLLSGYSLMVLAKCRSSL